MSPLGSARIHQDTHRLIASRYPTIGVFDDLAGNEEELRAAFLLESMTNDRVALLSQRLTLLPEGEVVSGPTASLVMAAFLHASQAGGRFTDGRLGAWYASLDVETAIEETLFHSERRLRMSSGAFPSNIQVRELLAGIDAALIDIRGMRGTRAELYDPDPDRYAAPQAFGTSQRWPDDGSQGANGIVYDSVRKAEGTCLCLFRPTLISLPVTQGDHYQYRWDASGTVTVLKLTNVVRD